MSKDFLGDVHPGNTFILTKNTAFYFVKLVSIYLSANALCNI